MTQFPRRASEPPRADSYRRLARLARGHLQTVEDLATATEPQAVAERKRAMQAVIGLIRDILRRL